MAKVKVIKTNLNENLNGDYFNDTPSNTIFSFGKFFVTTNFDNKTTINYTDSLSSFVRPVTLETLGINSTQSEIINKYTTNAVLNLDKSDLNTFVRYGSAYEFLRVSVQNIILAYPGSLFANSQKNIGGNFTFSGYTYDIVTNTSTFYVWTGCTVNTFGLVYNNGNTSIPDDKEIKNINESYEKYVIWSALEPNNLYPIIGYTGNTINNNSYYSGTIVPVKDYLKLQVQGNPFELLTTPTGKTRQDFHIRPNNVIFEEFRALLDNYEKYIVSKRNENKGFSFTLKDPTLLENGKIIYSDTNILWSTGDGYNIDINTPSYQRFLEILLTIGAKYDKIKTDLIARFLTPSSLKTYDFTEEGKISKLLRVYGREFDEIRQFIDSLVNINKVTYDKINNIPDQLIKNMARTFGWDYFSLVNETELVESLLTVDDEERDLNESLLPAEIDIELWRRIINNTNYFWKSKGTRDAIKSIFLLIGIPEPFINITEYVYTVDGKINPNTVPLVQSDFPSNSLPYDTEGYPVAPLETNDFYFQVSGNTDSGQAYLDVFRMAGFNLRPTPDNKKSWVQTGETTRIHYSTPQYYQGDSKLVINTKEVDIALDTARGIEYDVYEYIMKDFAVNSSGYTLPYSYVNISLASAGNTFTLPYNLETIQGDFEVRYNGILLNAPSISGVTGSTSEADYSVVGNTFTIPELSGGTRPSDVIQATLITSGDTAISGITVKYVVTRVNAKLGGTYLPLPNYPRGDVQVTINGIALTKGTAQFTADYILDPANSTGGTNNIIIQNPDVIAYLNNNPEVQLAYVDVIGSNDINMRSEIVRVDSFNTSKIYYNSSANKYVYKLNYKVNNASEIKFLVDGIALEPLKDYNINVQNPYEIFLPKGIRYGTVLSVYYLVGGNGAFNPVINDVFGLGDISQLSFLEFLELVQRKMINVRTRKTVTDFRGGWYPTVLKIYETYLERALLPSSNPLQSNGYTFENLYPFLSKYNAFFQRFVDQLLSATIILKRGGLLIRNSIFTKQKHWYKRGVNVADELTGYDLRGNELVQYMGDDGSKFQIIQEVIEPSPTPIQLYVETTPGVWGSLLTGGRNIMGYDELTSFGIDYKIEGVDDDWTRIVEYGTLTANYFSMTLTGLLYDTNYQYRAFVQSYTTGFTGNTLSIHTPVAPPPTPSVCTCTGTADTYLSGSNYYGRISNTGGYDICRYADVDTHALLYRAYCDTTCTWGAWTPSPLPPYTSILTTNSFCHNISSLCLNMDYQYRAYIIVSGTTYYGEIKSASIPSTPTSVFTVVTDGMPVLNPDGTSFDAENNTYVAGYPTTMLEYGIIYTQNASQGTIDNLIYTNDSVNKIIYIGNTASPFGTSATGLSPGTLTYYRAYVKNATGIGYGDIETIVTENQIIYITMSDVYIDDTLQYNINGCAHISATQTIPMGDCVILNYENFALSSTISMQSESISAGARMICDGINCNEVTSNVLANCIDYCASHSESYFMVNASNIDNIVACVCAISAISNDNTTLDNLGCVHLLGISCSYQPSGKIYCLTSARSLCVRNIHNT